MFRKLQVGTYTTSSNLIRHTISSSLAIVFWLLLFQAAVQTHNEVPSFSLPGVAIPPRYLGHYMIDMGWRN